MSVENGKCEFKLSRPVKYKWEGSDVETTSITLLEPGMEQYDYFEKLSQMLTQASMEFGKENNEIQAAVGEEIPALHEQTEKIENESDAMADAMLVMLRASKTVDTSQFGKVFKNMVLMVLEGQAMPVCKVDDRQNMTPSIWQRIHPADATKMAVRWCVFFAMPSEEGQQKESEQQSESHTELMEV